MGLSRLAAGVCLVLCMFTPAPLVAQGPGEPDTVAASLRRHLAPLTTVDPRAPGDDLAAFGAAVGDARVVALGEASHGTREVFLMKHRLFSYLVREKGFTVFALEANWPESEALDRYVKTGDGDPRAALGELYFWTWQTQEMLALIEWMREYNRAPGPHPVLSFTSFDMQREEVALERALTAVRGTPEENAVRAAYAVLQARSPTDTAGLENASELADGVVALLERAKVPARTTQLARVVAQAIRNRRGTIIGYRDQMMAVNALWLLREQYPGQKAVIWAHNSHVSVGDPTHDGPPRTHLVPMGQWMRVALGSQLYVLGFAINRGTVRANVFENGRRVGVQEAQLPPAAPGSGTLTLHAAGTPAFFLDFKLTDTPLQAWLAKPHAFQELGAGFDRALGLGMRMFPLSPRFNGLIYLDSTHATRGLQQR